jgi:hypothetical protein
MLGKLTLKIPNKRKLSLPIFVQQHFIAVEFVNLHLSNGRDWIVFSVNAC